MVLLEQEIFHPIGESPWDLSSMETPMVLAAKKRVEVFVKYDMPAPPLLSKTFLGDVLKCHRNIEFPCIEAVREFVIACEIYGWSDEVFQMMENNIITQRIRVSNDGAVIVDWVDIPPIRGQGIIDWVNGTIV